MRAIVYRQYLDNVGGQLGRMDDTQRAFYGLKFENAFLREKGKAFETLFARIMSHRYGEDFQPVRPYGSAGDLKCDGYRNSDRTVFQCYAPDSEKLSILLKKIEKDFLGAVQHWGNEMRRWVLVYNNTTGLPAQAVQKLNSLKSSHSNIQIASFGEAELRDEVMKLAIHQLEDLFGVVPSQRTLERLAFADLQPVLIAIQAQAPPPEPPLMAPSPQKLRKNALSQDASGLLRQGRRREKLVQDFFDAWPDPSFGESIAEGFRNRYQALKAVGLGSDDIFAQLQQFAGGMEGKPERQAAVLAVMSYFFERCDIYEDPLSGELV